MIVVLPCEEFDLAKTLGAAFVVEDSVIVEIDDDDFLDEDALWEALDL